VPLAEQGGVPHHLIDIVEPTAEYTAADYGRDAARVIREIQARGRLPFVVGGTGFYYRALTAGCFRARGRMRRCAPGSSASRRAAAFHPASHAAACGSGVGGAHPARDRKRLVRALEVFWLTGRPLTAHFAETTSPIEGMRVLAIALRQPAAQTSARVTQRVDQQFERGLLDEIHGLLARGVPESARPFGGLVYRQALEHLHGVRDELSTRALIAQENRRYARRQLIWFRKEPNLQWFDGSWRVSLDPVGSHPAARRTAQGFSVTFLPALPTRAIVIVLDSVGAGELPDAAQYGDEGSDTLGHIADQVMLHIPHLRSLGLARVARIGGPVLAPLGACGRMAEASAGKDSVTGHWEMMGIVLDRPFPVFPNGFPADVLSEFSRRTGRGVVGTRPRRERRSSTNLAPSTCGPRAYRLYIGRQRIPDCRARAGGAARRALSCLRNRLRSRR